ncbi:MAG TPA: alkaline phosphatase family protein, partial [Acidimicrobiales bacterium]|nr:alkaline phosphatase family protein [Acidimicrobiales bacterium]
FDHLLGWLPGANTEQHCTFLDDEGNPHETRHWAPDYTGNGYADPDHGWNGGRVQLGGEARDNSGFAKGRNDDFALGYYQRDDVPVYAAMAEQTTVFDRYHTAALGPTYVNRWYQHAGTAGGRRSNDFAPNPIEGWQERTIWDALDESGVTWAYYFSNLPVIGLYGERLLLRRLTNCRHISAYYADCAAGTLPQVAFVDPFFTVDGVGNDDHPHADLRLGQQFVDGVVSAFTSSSAWASGALFVNYDEWGGFFDHVVPTAARHDDHKSPVLADDSSQRGFRVPAFLASPYARRGVVAHGTYDHTSILRFLEWRYGLRPLSKRSATARNIGEVLDFAATPNLDPVAPGYVAPPDAWANVGATDLSMDLTAIRDIGLTDALRIRTDWAFEDSFLR